ncbi:MAG: SGNH/GDSL hydrolase family protein [Clostridia bacterium]|nr:SGNH/GDSL hydrolase family protein [Clostridia bacterium]
MKKVVLIGDSIRMGYDKYIKEALSGTAEVFYPSENCRFAEYVLRYAHDWKAVGEWGDDVDLVHWNAGLWDALELFGDEPLTPISCYGELIKRIDKRLRMLFPNAKLVFATSTNVSEKMSRPEFTRHNATIQKYNAEALRALSDTDTVINDLYSLTESVPDSYRSDWVHFYTPEGTELIGGKVLSEICELLDITPKQINIEDFESERYSKSNIGY